MSFYGEILKIIHFYHFDSDPRFPPFLLYVRWKSGATFVRRCFHDEKYVSTPMQYTAMFAAVKADNFRSV